MAMRMSKQAVTGTMFVVAGVILLGSELHLWRSTGLGQLWPLALIGVGLAFGGLRREGFHWLGSGVVLLLATVGVWPLRDSWPLLLVVHGVALMMPPSNCGVREQEATRVR